MKMQRKHNAMRFFFIIPIIFFQLAILETTGLISQPLRNSFFSLTLPFTFQFNARAFFELQTQYIIIQPTCCVAAATDGIRRRHAASVSSFELRQYNPIILALLAAFFFVATAPHRLQRKQNNNKTSATRLCVRYVTFDGTHGKRRACYDLV
jgi:hypothetical protein